jgi:hypothetical protein
MTQYQSLTIRQNVNSLMIPPLKDDDPFILIHFLSLVAVREKGPFVRGTLPSCYAVFI